MAGVAPGDRVWVANQLATPSITLRRPGVPSRPADVDPAYRARWLPDAVSTRPLWLPATVLALDDDAWAWVRLLTHAAPDLRVPVADLQPLNPVSGCVRCRLTEV
jgi:hypothetical protein